MLMLFVFIVCPDSAALGKTLDPDSHIHSSSTSENLSSSSYHNLSFLTLPISIDLDYAELPRVKDQLPIDFMPGAVFSRPSEQDRQLPLLENVFRAFPNTAINIDIKVPNDSLITKVSPLQGNSF